MFTDSGFSGFGQLSCSSQIKWSENTSRCPTADSECVVPAGEHWLLDADMDVATLTVQGTLTWDKTKSGITLRTVAIDL